jgi:hypothetical protein
MIERHASSLRESQLCEYVSNHGIIYVAWLYLRSLNCSFHNLRSVKTNTFGPFSSRTHWHQDILRMSIPEASFEAAIDGRPNS